MSRALANVARIDDQHALNRRRWAELGADSFLASLEHRIETDRFGQIIMMPPSGFLHSDRQGQIMELLSSHMKSVTGRARPECPVSTSGGVKGVDVIWISNNRLSRALTDNLLVEAPEICVEVISPANTVQELEEKRRLYFEAVAEEVWVCGPEGDMAFFLKSNPTAEADASILCPAFPARIND